MIKTGNRVHTTNKNKIEGKVLKVKDKFAWVQYGENGMFIEAFPVDKLKKKVNRKSAIPSRPEITSMPSAARVIQRVSKERLKKLVYWINNQRDYLQNIYNTIRNNLFKWTGKSNYEGSMKLLNAVYAAPKTPHGTPGYMYRKIVLYPGERVNLNLNRVSSWSLNPLFAASFRVNTTPTSIHLPKPEQVLLRLPLNTPASKLYIGDTSKLLNTFRRSIHGQPFVQEAEVILAPVNLEIARRRRVPLGSITGIDPTGQSQKRLSIQASTLYGHTPPSRKIGYHPSPPKSVSKGINEQQYLITVLDVKEKQ
jgi:hypothetical protein